MKNKTNYYVIEPWSHNPEAYFVGIKKDVKTTYYDDSFITSSLEDAFDFIREWEAE